MYNILSKIFILKKIQDMQGNNKVWSLQREKNTGNKTDFDRSGCETTTSKQLLSICSQN